MEDELVVVGRFSHVHEAHVARCKLESDGIEAFISDEHIVNAMWLQSDALGGVKVWVRRSEFERAEQTLAEKSPIDSDSGWGTCRKCGSTSLDVKVDRRGTFLTWLLIGIPLLAPKTRIRCSTCGTTGRKSDFNRNGEDPRD